MILLGNIAAKLRNKVILFRNITIELANKVGLLGNIATVLGGVFTDLTRSEAGCDVSVAK